MRQVSFTLRATSKPGEQTSLPVEVTIVEKTALEPTFPLEQVKSQNKQESEEIPEKDFGEENL